MLQPESTDRPTSTDPPRSHWRRLPPDRTSGASWRLGHSPAGGVSQPASAPGVAEAARRQGAPDEGAGSEGGPEPGQRASSRRPVRQRPRNRRQRTAVSVRLSPRELAVIDAGATAAEVTRATYMARAALAAAADPERTAALIASNRETLAELFAAHRTLRTNGNLLNQAVKALHTGERPAQLDAAVVSVQQAVEELKDATGRFVVLMNPQREGR